MLHGQPASELRTLCKLSSGNEKRSIRVHHILLGSILIALGRHFPEIVPSANDTVFRSATLRYPATVGDPQFQCGIERSPVNACLTPGDNFGDGHGQPHHEFVKPPSRSPGSTGLAPSPLRVSRTRRPSCCQTLKWEDLPWQTGNSALVLIEILSIGKFIADPGARIDWGEEKEQAKMNFR